MPAGRPSTFSPELAGEICGRLAGGESLNKICKENGMPSMVTVYQWIATNKEFANNYMRAREDQADTLADEIKDISDNMLLGKKTKISTNDKGEVTEEIVTADMVDRAKLQVEARKWIAAKLKPKKYGDKVQTEITGADSGPVQVDITGVDAYRKLIDS